MRRAHVKPFAWWRETILLAVFFFIVQSLLPGWRAVEPEGFVLREGRGFPWIWYWADYEHNKPRQWLWLSRAVLDVSYLVTLTAVIRVLLHTARAHRAAARRPGQLNPEPLLARM